jgi:hypothetical protein
MRVAQIAPPWLLVPPEGYRGVERLVGHLTEGLADRGHDVTLFAPHESRTGLVSSAHSNTRRSARVPPQVTPTRRSRGPGPGPAIVLRYSVRGGPSPSGP